MSGSLFDFGMYFFNSGPPLIAAGLAPFFYLPKMESHLEARLWNDVFSYAEDAGGDGARDDQGDGADRDAAGRV